MQTAPPSRNSGKNLNWHRRLSHLRSQADIPRLPCHRESELVRATPLRSRPAPPESRNPSRELHRERLLSRLSFGAHRLPLPEPEGCRQVYTRIEQLEHRGSRRQAASHLGCWRKPSPVTLDTLDYPRFSELQAYRQYDAVGLTRP